MATFSNLAATLFQLLGLEDKDQIQTVFWYSQIILGGLFALFAYRRMFGTPITDTSQFQIREFEKDHSRLKSIQPKKKEPLRLTGIRIDGKPHEILGVSELATNEEIKKAYRELMKIYHPDKIGRVGTPEWKEAQVIAEAINQAKTKMLKAS